LNSRFCACQTLTPSPAPKSLNAYEKYEEKKCSSIFGSLFCYNKMPEAVTFIERKGLFWRFQYIIKWPHHFWPLLRVTDSNCGEQRKCGIVDCLCHEPGSRKKEKDWVP
jgi:hypothetical protein